MSIEVWSTIAAVGTFLVIGATAVAALVQLRHLRASNQLHAMLTLVQMEQSPGLEEKLHFVRTELADRMKEADFRKGLDTAGIVDRVAHPEIQVCRWFEQIGIFVKCGFLDKDAYFDRHEFVVRTNWDLLEPVIAVMRRKRGSVVYENFEYLAVQARAFMEKHPSGNYPRSEKRIQMTDAWLATDAELAKT